MSETRCNLQKRGSHPLRSGKTPCRGLAWRHSAPGEGDGGRVHSRGGGILGGRAKDVNGIRSGTNDGTRDRTIVFPQTTKDDWRVSEGVLTRTFKSLLRAIASISASVRIESAVGETWVQYGQGGSTVCSGCFGRLARGDGCPRRKRTPYLSQRRRQSPSRPPEAVDLPSLPSQQDDLYLLQSIRRAGVNTGVNPNRL